MAADPSKKDEFDASTMRLTRATSVYDFSRAPAERAYIPWTKTAVAGYELIRNPFYNKGLGFTWSERRDLHLHGLLPPRYRSLKMQAAGVVSRLEKIDDLLDKYTFLMQIMDTNEKLFFYVLCTNMSMVMPIVYTPTVGRACQRFGYVFNSPRGIWLTIRDRGRVFEVLKNWPFDNVQAVCVTDGERILGLGDLGAHGMGIPIGKLALYTGCAGVKPYRLLPVMLDVGTNNKELRKADYYIGIDKERTRGDEYDKLVDEFMRAVTARWGPTTLIQFEDFGNSNAFRLLVKYRNDYCTFNDDIQGTASVALAGILASLRVEDALCKVSDHTILMFGAGSAGVGIADLLAYAMQKRDGIPLEEARKHIWLTDSAGIVYKGRKTGRMDSLKRRYAHDGWEHGDCKSLPEIIGKLKATALIGVSGQGQSFDEATCKALLENTKRPIVFPMSNPTSKAECTAEQAYGWTNGACIFASGSPFDALDVQAYGKKAGETTRVVPAQGNNAYCFPGLALGVIASKSARVTQEMFVISAEVISGLVTDEMLANGTVFPPIDSIRDVSFAVAVATAREAFGKGLAREVEPRSFEELIRANMYSHESHRFYHDSCFDSLEEQFGDDHKLVEEEFE